MHYRNLALFSVLRIIFSLALLFILVLLLFLLFLLFMFLFLRILLSRSNAPPFHTSLTTIRPSLPLSSLPSLRILIWFSSRLPTLHTLLFSLGISPSYFILLFQLYLHFYTSSLPVVLSPSVLPPLPPIPALKLPLSAHHSKKKQKRSHRKGRKRKYERKCKEIKDERENKGKEKKEMHLIPKWLHSFIFHQISLYPNTVAVAVDGQWGDWGPWGLCAGNCGEGTQTRSRQCDSPAPEHGGEYCQGDPTETQSCQGCTFTMDPAGE